MQLKRSTWDIASAMGSTSWTRELEMPSGRATVGDTFDSLLALRLKDGGDRLSARGFEGATPAARRLLASPTGAPLSQLLSSVLAGYDGRKGLANVQGVVLADTLDGAALVTGAAFANVINDMGVRRLVVGEAATASSRADAIGALRIGTAKAGGFSGFAPDWIVLAPHVSGPLLELAERGAGNLSASQAVAAARALAVLRHEVAHTVEPVLHPEKAFRSQAVRPYGFPMNRLLTISRMGWLAERGLLAKLESSAVSPTIWLEESIADLESMDHGEARDLLTRVGLPATPDALAQFTPGYPPYAEQFDRLLKLAGLDRTRPTDLADARRLVQTVSLADVPTALADRIAKRAGAGDEVARRVAELIASAGVGANLGSRTLPEGFRAKIDEVERLASGGPAHAT